MQTGSIPHSPTDWLSLAAKMLPIIVILAMLLEFRPPKPPEPPAYRIDPGVMGLEFYNAGCGEQDGEHQYGYRFAKKDTRCIFAKQYIPPNTPEARGRVFFYDANGHEIGGSDLLVVKESSVTVVATYTGWDETGHWQPGMYRVEVIVEGKLIAAGEFLITDP